MSDVIPKLVLGLIGLVLATGVAFVLGFIGTVAVGAWAVTVEEIRKHRALTHPTHYGQVVLHH